MPLYRRLPKRGFNNFEFEARYTILNVDKLNAFEDGTEVTPELLKETGIIRKIEKDGVKILGNGSIERNLQSKLIVHKISYREDRSRWRKGRGDLMFKTLQNALKIPDLRKIGIYLF